MPSALGLCSCGCSSPAPAQRRLHRRHGRQLPVFTVPALRSVRVRALPDPQNPESYEGGDARLQESLVNQIKFEIGKKQVESFVEEKGEELKKKAEEAKEEIDKLGELTELKADLAFNSALADINKEADVFEEELRKNRERLQAEERELSQWEQDVAVSRSQGMFFQNLYQEKKERPVGMDVQQLKERAERVKEPARQELGSTLRLYTFAVSAAVLAASVVVDLQSDSPSPGQDLLYVVLAALLVWSSFNERRAL